MNPILTWVEGETHLKDDNFPKRVLLRLKRGEEYLPLTYVPVDPSSSSREEKRVATVRGKATKKNKPPQEIPQMV